MFSGYRKPSGFINAQNVRIRVEWPDPIQRIAMLVGTAGGTTRAVGGTVIDIIMHGDPKDWDLEVYGV